MDELPERPRGEWTPMLWGGAWGFIVGCIPLVMLALPLAFALSGPCVDSEGVPVECGFSPGWIIVWAIVLAVPLLTWLGARIGRRMGVPPRD